MTSSVLALSWLGLGLAFLLAYQVPGIDGQRCGRCEPNEEREPNANPFICGRCVSPNIACDAGYYRDGGNCLRCPCHITNTPCSRDPNSGQIVCSCPTGYAGATCDKCVPGYRQESNYPYRCVRSGTGGGPPPTNLPRGCPDNPTPVCPIGPRPLCPTRPVGCGNNCTIPTTNGCKTNDCCVNGGNTGNNCCVNGGNSGNNCCGNGGNTGCGNTNCAEKCPTNCPGGGNCGCRGDCGDPCSNDCGNRCGERCEDPCPGKCGDPCPGKCGDPCPQRCGDPCPQSCGDPCPQSCGDPCPGKCGDPCPQRCGDPCPQRCGDPCPGRCGDPCPGKCGDPCPAKCNFTCEGSAITLDVCVLECDPRGTYRVGGGTCICKKNVEGGRCDSCKPGYFGLQAGNVEGCSACFCSGLTTSCRSAIFYRQKQAIDLRVVSVLDSMGAVVQPSSASPNRVDFSFSSRSGQYYWVLPAVASGNLLTAYGGELTGYREYSSSSSIASVPGDDVIVEGSNGASLFWSTTAPVPSGANTKFEVKLDEFQGWMTWRNKGSFLASRTDILSVLADVRRILIRAAFTPSGMTRSTLSNVELGLVSDSFRSDGLTFRVEDCQCPTGYQGHSCESCERGYYRDVTDMSKSIFGACKLCPCGNNAEGCRLIFGLPQCICKAGYSGPRCLDRDSCSLTMNPCRVRDCIGTLVEFNCSYSSSKVHSLSIRTEPPTTERSAVQSSLASITLSLNLSTAVRQVVCELRNSNNDLVAVAYSKLEPEPCQAVIPPPPGPNVRVIAEPKFICVEVGATVKFNCTAWSFASSMLTATWTRSGRKPLPRGAVINTPRSSSHIYLTINSVDLEDTGTYYCVAGANVVQVDSVNLVVKKTNVTLGYPFHEEFHDAPSLVLPQVESRTDPAPPPAQVSIYPSELSVNVGESAEFRCKVAEEREGVEVYWRRQESPIALDVAINGSRLSIHSVQASHAGSYYCIFSDAQRKSSAKAILHVKERKTRHIGSDPSNVVTPNPTPKPPNAAPLPSPPPALHLSMFPHAHTIKPGTNMTLGCTSEQAALDGLVVWSRENGDLPPSSISSQDASGRLLLLSVAPEDSGLYVCSARTAAGEKLSGKIHLNVQKDQIMPLVAIAPASPHTVRAGQRVRLECQATGEPLPVLTWSKFVNTVEGDHEQVLLEAQTPNAAFEIRRATKAHAGEYFCTGKNGAGTDRGSLELIVVEDGVECGNHEFRCHSGDQCIPIADRCDGEKDCKDHSDERACRKRHATRR